MESLKKNWHIEEAGFGEPSDACFLIIDPTAEIDGILECIQALRTPDIQRVHIVFDTKCQPLLVQACLKGVKDIMPGREVVIKHVDGLIIALMGQLWRRMKAYSERGKE